MCHVDIFWGLNSGSRFNSKYEHLSGFLYLIDLIVCSKLNKNLGMEGSQICILCVTRIPSFPQNTWLFLMLMSACLLQVLCSILSVHHELSYILSIRKEYSVVYLMFLH